MEPYLVLPQAWDEFTAFEVEEKGWFEARVVVSGREESVSFYDPVRLAQEIDADVAAHKNFAVHNLIVVEHVTADEMSRAISRLSQFWKR